MLPKTAKSPRRKSLQIIGGYQILNQIGQGSFSHVNLAKNIETREFLCVKIMNKRKFTNDVEVRSLKKEVRILSQIKHENIVKFYDFHEDLQNYYIFMEFCEGDNLNNMIERSPSLPISYVKNIFKQILNALNFLHEKGIAHRDLKPENIIIDSADHVKIIDFGLSTDDASHLRETYCGSLAYAAPECIKHIPYDATKADVWSAGLTLFTMLTGHLPWKSRDIMGISKEISFEDVNIPYDIPVAPSALLKQMLIKDPNLRPSVKEILNNTWLKEISFTPSVPSTPKMGIRNRRRTLATARNNTHPIFFPMKRRTTLPVKQTVKRFVPLDY